MSFIDVGTSAGPSSPCPVFLAKLNIFGSFIADFRVAKATFWVVSVCDGYKVARCEAGHVRVKSGFV